MKSKRRDFIKLAGLTGFGLASSTLKGFSTMNTVFEGQDLPQIIREFDRLHVQRFNMSGYSAPKIDNVRVGIIGLRRGLSYIRNMGRCEGLEIRALCDLRPEVAEVAKNQAEELGHKPFVYSGDKEIWKKMCERDDLDLVVISTPWTMHAEQGIFAMEHGKHVASEVPAAGTLEECWQLVKTSELTRKHFMMMENYSYMHFHLLTLNMARNGMFGDIVHGDCAYNTSKMFNNFNKTGYWDMWWLREYASRRGNIYPTHGLGPVCQIMDINRGDKLDYLVSVESNDFMMQKRAQELAKEDKFFKPFAEKEYRGNMNVTTIRTKNGRTIMLQHDATTPSPHNLIHGIHGTRGAALYDPPPPRLSIVSEESAFLRPYGNHEWVSEEEFNLLREKFTPRISKIMGELARESGHGGSDLLIQWHLIDCLRNGLPVPSDVYDAADWSSIIPLSEWSVLNRSNSINIPDFTAGAWKTNQRNIDINIERGGTTKVIR